MSIRTSSKAISWLANQSLWWLIVLAIACYPIIGTSTVIIGVPSRPAAVTYRAGYLGLAFLLMLFSLPRLKQAKFSLPIVFLSAFWLIYTFRIIFDFFVAGLNSGYARNGGFFFLQYGLGGCFFPALVVGSLVGRVKYDSLVHGLRWCYALSCIFIVVFLIATTGFTIELFYTRAKLGEASVVGPILLSQTGGALFVLVLTDRFIRVKSSIHDSWQMLLGIAFLIMGASRGPLAITLFIAGMVGFSYFRRAYLKPHFWLSILGLIAVLTMGFLWFVLPNLQDIQLFARIASTIEQGQGLDDRSRQWSSAWSQFLGNPIWGDRVTERALGSYPHNLVLEVLMSTGIIGFIPFLTCLLFAGYKFINNHLVAVDFRPLFYLFTLYFGFSLFSNSLITMVQFWILLAMTAAVPFTLQQSKMEKAALSS